MLCISLVIACISLTMCSGHILKAAQERPPMPIQEFYSQTSQSVSSEMALDRNAWENSGLLEGDIVEGLGHQKNGLLSIEQHWPNATVPFFIDDEFSNDQVKTILNAIQEYHNRTCVRFRAYKKNDTNWLHIKGNKRGCWSNVGMQGSGQVVNLEIPVCVTHGVTLHELLHALGFYHQQSASDRDEFVKIHWENIKDGQEHNFKKYNTTVVTDYNVTYDYQSVMHYSGKAFSKNNETTIEPLDSAVKLGQRNGLSDKDVLKLNKMYEGPCHKFNDADVEQVDKWIGVLNWVENMFGI